MTDVPEAEKEDTVSESSKDDAERLKREPGNSNYHVRRLALALYACQRDHNAALARAASLEAERDRLKEYIDRLPANWLEDSSLETWFPLTATHLTEAESALAELRGKIAGEWTSVEAGLPPATEMGYTDHCLCFDDGGARLICMGRYSSVDGEFRWIGNYEKRVTHWRPLPAPPALESQLRAVKETADVNP